MTMNEAEVLLDLRQHVAMLLERPVEQIGRVEMSVSSSMSDVSSAVMSCCTRACRDALQAAASCVTWCSVRVLISPPLYALFRGALPQVLSGRMRILRSAASSASQSPCARR